MVIAAKLYLEHPDLPLTPTIQSLGGGELGVFSDVGTDPEHDVYIFWIEAPEFDAVERALAEDHTVTDCSVIVESEGRWTCRVEYSEDVTLITPGIVDAGGLTVEARSYSNGWLLHVQLPDHDALYAINEYATARDIHLDILELHADDDSDDRREYWLTEAQREALVSAYVQGYYDTPRTTSLEDLASSLGITSTAASGRLRRGSARLVEEALVDEED